MENHIPQNSAHGDPFFNTVEYHNCLQEAADYVLKRLGIDKIDVSIVEGSGLLEISDHLFREAGDTVKVISLNDIPHCPIPTAIGHKQDVLYAEMQGRKTIIWNGRIHYYEGYRIHQQAFPAFLSAYMGCSVFITTNAAGFINQKMAIGDLALITDHISMIHKAYDGVVSLDKQLFNEAGALSTSKLYDQEMVDLAREAILEAGVKLTEGPYCYFALPNYESPAEIQIMHDLGAATVGASTLPEQIACYMTGMRRVIISSATSPSAGMSSEQIDGEEVLIGGQKCVSNFAKVIPVLISKLGDQFFVKERPNKLQKMLESPQNLKMQRIGKDFNQEDLVHKIISVIRKKVGDAAKFTQCFWLMSDSLTKSFIKTSTDLQSTTVYFINLRDIAPLRTRSYEDGQIIIVMNKEGDCWLALRQPYLEGMLPYEYAVLLKALKKLNVTKINIYVEASSVSDDSLNGHVHHVSQFFNKRFYKYTETGRDYHAENQGQITAEEHKNRKYLFVSEGNMLPSKTELQLAKKAKFDLYTITNLSVIEIAEYLTMRPNLIAVAKHNLADKDEVVHSFSSKDWFVNNTTFNLSEDVASIPARAVELQYSASFDVHHSKECIYETASKLKEVVGLVDNVAVFERETYESFVHELVQGAGLYKVDKAVRLNLKDYKGGDKHVDLVKVTSQGGLSVLIISDTLSYQSHVPFQALMLPMRIAILGVEAKNFISCPHIWNLKWEKNSGELKAGDLFVVKDHASISAQSPGIGPNIDEFGPRFYDISSMYEKRFTHLINEIIGSHPGVAHAHGEVFWVNNSALPSGDVFTRMAEGLSNHKVTFKGVTKTGISELMAVHHRQSQSPYKLTSAMVGIITDSTIRKQTQHERYSAGVKNLASVLFEAFSKINA